MNFSPELQKLCEDEAMDYFLVRSKERAREYGEIFTPTKLVLELLSQLPDTAWEEGKTYSAPAAGNGKVFVPVLYIKASLRHKNPLASIYGVELLQDNVDECRFRLLEVAGQTEENNLHVMRNIRCADALKFDFNEFKES